MMSCYVIHTRLNYYTAPDLIGINTHPLSNQEREGQTKDNQQRLYYTRSELASLAHSLLCWPLCNLS